MPLSIGDVDKKQIIMKNRSLLLILTLLLPLSIFAQQRYVVTTQELNVRTAPSASSKVVDKVRQGDVVTVVSINNGWAKIVHKKQERYVSSKYLSKVVTNDTYSQNNSYDQKQDIIVLKNGHAIVGKVIEVNRDDIIYQPEDNNSSSSINIAAVQYIRYANGAQKNFSSNSSEFGYDGRSNDSNTISFRTEQQEDIPEQFGSYGAFYVAPFEDAGVGYYGVKADIYRPLNFWGVTFATGMNVGLVDKESYAAYFAVGPSGIYPLNSSFYLVCPLRFVGESYTQKDSKTMKDKEKFIWGIDLVPSVLLHHKKWSFNLGFDVKWTKGNKKLGTGFLVNIGYEI